MTRPWLLLLIVIIPFSPRAETVSLADQLRGLSDRHQFTISGLQHTEDSPPSEAAGELPQQLRAMLADFSFVLQQPPGGPVERLIIIGLKGESPSIPPPSSVETTLETKRSGDHHVVSATLIGDEGQEISVELMVDTGATLVVLPRSLAPQLGILDDSLRPREIKTAAGKITADVATLPKLRLGSEEITEVETAFIEDSKLGEVPLLGMNVLSRYKIVLDDESGTLVLEPRAKDE